MIIEYLTQSGHLQIKIDNHRHCLSREQINEGITFPDSDTSNELQLVQAVWKAMLDMPLSAEPRKLVFNSDKPELLISDDVDSVYGRFNDSILAYDNSRFQKIADLAELKDEEDKPETVTKTRTKVSIEIKGGKAVRVVRDESYEEPLYDNFPLEDEDGKPIMDKEPSGDTEEAPEDYVQPRQLTHRVPRMIKGSKVSDKDKNLLKQLKNKTII